ncbi:Fpg/Nei family DNA glycosylase [Hufsiella ginkgonis]|uniref:Fpg/Nei family DNA glycosylase n=1 Tax=Hufsiella ginkgonis TaxID=2695274 RepID=A0A7K1XTM8_9SPHI|nr:DNA-formamidopyrimidine glycosylase family protein [Hufsiella ginkgonis]MXV14371.1 Fpg/Nei family DNA glycosylase [Hufsiella ginkgonis]
MPELPDLQVFSANLTKKLQGKTVEKVVVQPFVKINVSRKALSDALEGQRVKTVKRVGKELHFEIGDQVLGIHLMLHGKLYLFEGARTEKFPVIEILFKDGMGMVLTDFQKAAKPTLNPEATDTPDALSDEVSKGFLAEKFSRSRSAVKTVLLDQHFIRGIGNAYADEILWDAGIAPSSKCNKIPEEKIGALARSIRSVLEDAEKQIRKADPDIIAGEIRDFMKVHNSRKTESPGGSPILHETIGGRKTYYTVEQKIYE